MSGLTKAPFRRADLKPGEVLCSYCTAICCRYFSLPIHTPTDWDDFDNLRWYLTHGRCALYVEGRTWYLLVYGDCKYLMPDNRCGVYHERPKICGEYTTANCEFDNDFVFDKFFESPEQIWEFAEAILPPREQLLRDSLPIVTV